MQLQQVEAYGVECGLTLLDGRAITLVGISQSMTYDGLLEGHPTTQDNDRSIAHFLAAEQKRTGHKPLLIEPHRRASWREQSVSADDVVERRPPEWLPMIVCIALFRSFPISLDGDADESELSVLWFQDHYALPISEEALERIRAVDWASRAREYQL